MGDMSPCEHGGFIGYCDKCSPNWKVEMIDEAKTHTPDDCDHDWELQDDSFDHEYGTELVHYWRCIKCEATKDMEPGDYD